MIHYTADSNDVCFISYVTNEMSDFISCELSYNRCNIFNSCISCDNRM